MAAWSRRAAKSFSAALASRFANGVGLAALSNGPASIGASDARILAGAVRAALAARCFELGWITRRHDIRVLLISDNGKRGFGETFGIDRVA